MSNFIVRLYMLLTEFAQEHTWFSPYGAVGISEDTNTVLVLLLLNAQTQYTNT